MIYHHLYKKYATRNHVNVGVIGAGNYGTAVVTQAPYTPLLTVVAVADISAEAAKKAYQKSKLDPSRIVYCETLSRAQSEIEKGNYIFTDRCELIPQLPIVDIICESTGSPEASATYALAAINHGKHVAMCTKDCDVSIGPILKKLAKDKGVVYTPVDGDQQGLLIQLYEWAKIVGLTVINAGKSSDGEFIYDEHRGTITIQTDKPVQPPYRETITVEQRDRKYLEMIPPGAAEEYIKRRIEIMSGLPSPGAYDFCEMTIAANYTGLKPTSDTLWHAPLRITEMPIAYATRANGGVIESEETIDMASCLRGPIESGMGGGVYLVVHCDNDYSNHIVTSKGQISNRDGTASVIYRPYHLCGVETSISLLNAVLLGLDTGSDDYRPRWDLVKVAAEEIAAGEVIGNDHSSKLSARILPASPVANGRPASAHLLTGNRAKVKIPRGTVITYDMVEEPPKSTLWELRRLQDKTFST